jgi:hypothetical protein
MFEFESKKKLNLWVSSLFLIFSLEVVPYKFEILLLIGMKSYFIKQRL